MRIEIFSTILTAFKFCWTHRTQFYFLALPAVILLAIFSTLIMIFQPQEGLQLASFETANQHIRFSKDFFLYSYTGSIWQGLALFLLLLFKIFIFSLYSVAWHRFYLAPKENIKILDCYIWKNRHWQFLWANLKIFALIVPIVVLAFLATLASMFLAPLVGVIMTLLVLVCYARFSMWLPSSAVDQQLSLNDVLFLTKGNGWRLAIILLITGLIAGVLDGIATTLIANASSALKVVGDLTQDLLTKLALYFIMYAGIAVGITALSVSYQKLLEAHKTHRTVGYD